MVSTMDIREQWQTRLVLIVDGLDSCEQDKVLQVLDTINLVIPENSPFVVLLALDPHIIIKGIEANQLKVRLLLIHATEGWLFTKLQIIAQSGLSWIVMRTIFIKWSCLTCLSEFKIV